MTILGTPAARKTPSAAAREALARLYVLRFVFAAVWAGVILATTPTEGAWLTVLLVVYPLFDAGAVLWQLRATPDPHGPRTLRISEWSNVVVSTVVAVALGIAGAVSVSAALVVWGAWAICSGIAQLLTAIRNRHAGGQVAQMLSGGVSVLAGASFLGEGANGSETISSVGGYAALGGVFFLISALRLKVAPRR